MRQRRSFEDRPSAFMAHPPIEEPDSVWVAVAWVAVAIVALFLCSVIPA